MRNGGLLLPENEQILSRVKIVDFVREKVSKC